jgi:cytochrome c5
MNKLILSAVLALGVSGLAQGAAVEDRYNKTCVVCHAAGAAGAPKTGVAAEWEPRMAKGMDALVQSVDKGMGAMPAKGMCFDCDAAEFKALIEYMTEAK